MFSVSVTFNPNLDTKMDGHLFWLDLIEDSFKATKPTAIECWQGQQAADGASVLVGCEDGSVYAFRQTTPLPGAQQTHGEQRRRRPKSPQPLSPRLPTSPVSGSLGLSLTRAKVVSGVTTEKVEAPKNYVDFDEETDKLKDILQGKHPKEKHYGSDTASITGASRAPSIAESIPGSKRDSPTRSTLSIEVESVSRPRSFLLHPASSEQSGPTRPFHLSYHIIPTVRGSQNAVRAFLLLEGNSYFAALHKNGYLSIYSVKDGACVASLPMANDQPGHAGMRDAWNWSHLQSASSEEETIILATAVPTSNGTTAATDGVEAIFERSHTVAFKLTRAPYGIQLDRLGRLEVDGPANGIGIYRILEETLVIYLVNLQGHLLLREMYYPRTVSSSRASVNPTPESDHTHSLALTKSIKAMVSRSSEHVDAGAVTLPNIDSLQGGELHDAGPLFEDAGPSTVAVRRSEGTLYGLAWTRQEITVFSYGDSSLKITARDQISGIQSAEWLDSESYALIFNDRIDLYKLRVLDAHGNTISPKENASGGTIHHPGLIRTFPIGEHHTVTLNPSLGCVVAKTDEENRRLIVAHQTQNVNVSLPSTLLWRSKATESAGIAQTASLPIELECIVQGYSDGRLRQFSLSQLIAKEPLSNAKTSHGPLSGSLTGLNVIQNTRTRERYIVGGADDGSIAFWNLSTLELCARWTAFSTPLLRVIDCEQDSSALLHGCVLCIATDGTIAVVVVDGFQFLYLIPGSPFPLSRLSVQGANLMLVYSNQLARIWDLHAKEFHRSMSFVKAEELLREGQWTMVAFEHDALTSHCEWSPISTTHVGPDAVATLALSLEHFITNATAITKTISTNKDEVRSILLTFSRLRLLLSLLLTPGLNPDVDSICTGKLRVSPSNVAVGLPSLATTTIYSARQPRDVWCISGHVSALRLVAIVYVLRALSLFEESAEAANAVIAFYTTSLPICIGEKFEAPSLTYLAQMWFDASSELRQAIRIVFDSTLSSLSDQQIIAIAEQWQSFVPFAQPENERDTAKTALALFLCGFIAAEKFSLLSVREAHDIYISRSVAICFHDDQSTHRVLAIDLCSKGFTVWQQYVDTLDILRSLFMLATTTKKSSISLQNVGAQARSAVLSIAAQNTALFMSTLCLDVLDPLSMEHRRSVMQILAFLIRKRPLILQPHLPRLMESVVKSLDPNSKGDREAILGAATEIIGNVVKTYPTIDFHMAAQRLAVGTNEGAVIMYDLKTAIRLYVLEGHRQQLTALSFSPDGRRLVTVSLSDQHVMVWKVGGGFTSFFTPGLPPRQGSGGSEPFKTFPFHLGNDTNVHDSLDAVSFEWSGDRSVKVKMGESVLTFST